ncbi:hypothetical protein Daus18300_013368 [Diaporthe australafricana]|uniref:RTA1 domain-containing protein n=1 Tax=Diaporthe australafricana TaxID=127596 RepID=A0ABR3VZD4_9PEZI
MNSTTAEGPGAGFNFQLYRYTPSLAAAVVCVVVFAILTILHTGRMFKARAFYFTAFTIGGIFKGEHLSLIPVHWVTRLFVTGDVIAFGLQAGGGGIQAGGSLEMYETGEKIIIAGLFVQICVFGFFVVTSVLFHVRLAKSPTGIVVAGEIPWRRYLNVLYITSAIILVRSIFRVVEYLQGNSGYLISHEIFLYMFDALLMSSTMAIFVVWYVDHLDGTRRRKSFEERHLSESSGYVMEEASLHRGR